MRIRLLLKLAFFFPGTFLHELAHYLFALILGKAEGFSVFPRIEGDRFIFGSVTSRTRFKVLSSFVAAAPLLWWALIILSLIHFRLLIVTGGMPAVDCSPVFKRLHSIPGRDILLGWLFLQVLWAGRLSGQDIRNILRGLVSLSGFVFLASVAGLLYVSRTLR